MRYIIIENLNNFTRRHMKNLFFIVLLLCSGFFQSSNGLARAAENGYHGQILCACDDINCIQQRFHHHTIETGICLAGLALEVAIPGHSGPVLTALKCGIHSGLTVYEVAERIKACTAIQSAPKGTKKNVTDYLINCIAGSTVSSAQLTQNILSCTAGIEAGGAITSCAWNIGTGIVKVGDNAICLAGDLKSLRESQLALTTALNGTLRARAPRRSGGIERACNEEETSCNTFALRKFGIWLGQQSYWSYGSQSYLCADMCGNKGRGGLECKANANEIFGEDKRQCSPVCSSAQCDEAINRCVSYCCRQSGSCANAAHEKMNYYKLK